LFNFRGSSRFHPDDERLVNGIKNREPFAVGVIRGGNLQFCRGVGAVRSNLKGHDFYPNELLTSNGLFILKSRLTRFRFEPNLDGKFEPVRDPALP
jgi:hypothetical protein